MNDIITRIKKLAPAPTETIVVEYNFDKINAVDMSDILNCIESKFPNNTVMAIPDHISLQSCSRSVLESLISSIAEIIESSRPKMRWLHEAAPFYCSNCGNDEMYKTKFCPECGAKEEDSNG